MTVAATPPNTRSHIGYKIRSAEMKKTPYMLVVGEKEQQSGSVAVRRHGEGDKGSMSLEQFIETIQKEIQEKKNR